MKFGQYWGREEMGSHLGRMIFKRLAATFALALLLAAWLSLPAQASVQSDVKAGLPMAKVIDNGLKAGLSPEAVLEQALKAGADFCSLLRAAVAKKMDLAVVYRVFLKRYRSDPQAAGIYNVCTLIRCSVYAGKNLKEVGRAIMKAGASEDEVRACMIEIGCGEAFEYTPYVPTPPPTTPTIPGQGGTGSPSE